MPPLSSPPLMRRALPADAEAVRTLTRAAYAKWVPAIGREPKPMTANYHAAVQAHQIDLLTVQGNLAALIEMIHEADHLLIENIAVAPAHQGHGLGRQLMAHAEAVAAACGYRQVRLYTNSHFTENIALYTALGYRVARQETWSGGITVHMEKPLPAATHEPTEATRLVQRQLDAYNAHDIDAFMACWADDCRYHAFPSTLLAESAAAIRARHVERFAEPDLYGRLVQRIAMGPLVIDQEVVTRTFAEGPGEVDVVAIYEVRDGHIAQAWFQMGTPRRHPPARAPS